jgi:hypothetical protein
MSTITDYTDAEWQTLTDAIAMVWVTVSTADMNLISLFNETKAAIQYMEEGKKTYQNSLLILNLITTVLDGKMQPPNEKLKTVDEFVTKAEAKLHEAIAILKVKATPEEMTDFQNFAYGVGERVANAFGTGVFGKGEKVTEKEAEVLAKLKTALEM